MAPDEPDSVDREALDDPEELLPAGSTLSPDEALSILTVVGHRTRYDTHSWIV